MLSQKSSKLKKKMNVKKYKLVPISFFNGLSDSNDMENKHDNEKSRSLRDIIPAAQDTNFKPSKHYVADFKIEPSIDADRQSGAGWFSEKKSNILPGKGPRYLDETLNELLDNQTVPEDLKIKLYMILKQKYDNVETGIEHIEKKDEKMALFDTDVESPRSVLSKIINKMGNRKVKNGFILSNILVDESKNLRWNAAGDITYPKLKDHGAFDMTMLVKAILTKDVSHENTMIAEKIIRPFYHRLVESNVIYNNMLVKKIHPNNMSKYISW